MVALKTQALAGVGANHTMEGNVADYDDYEYDPDEFIPKENMMSNYKRVISWPVVKRSYERPLNLYYATFKPFDHNYDPEKIQLEHVRKKIASWCKTSAIIITREIEAKKHHYNAMFWTTVPLLDLKVHDTCTNLFKVWCNQVPLVDKYNIHDYIIKESRIRYFKPKKDVYSFPKVNLVDKNALNTLKFW